MKKCYQFIGSIFLFVIGNSLYSKEIIPSKLQGILNCYKSPAMQYSSRNI